MIELTLDTNVLRDYLDPHRGEHHEHAKALVRLDNEKICEIRVVSRYMADVPKGELRDRLNELAICQRPTIGTIAQWDISSWDVDFWATEQESEIYERLFQLIFADVHPNSKKQNRRAADVGHILGHMRAKRAIFVTRDGELLKQANKLLRDFRISVMTPADAIRHCNPE